MKIFLDVYENGKHLQTEIITREQLKAELLAAASSKEALMMDL